MHSKVTAIKFAALQGRCKETREPEGEGVIKDKAFLDH